MTLTPLAVSVLALLRERPMHPYEMYSLLIHRQAEYLVKVRPGSLYHTVERLARDELGVNTFRMGIEWSRIFPDSTAAVDISDEGGTVSLADLQALDALADADEVAHYRDVFAALRFHGLEPLVTVNHFTLPVWVHDPVRARPHLGAAHRRDPAGQLDDVGHILRLHGHGLDQRRRSAHAGHAPRPAFGLAAAARR